MTNERAWRALWQKSQRILLAAHPDLRGRTAGVLLRLFAVFAMQKAGFVSLSAGYSKACKTAAEVLHRTGYLCVDERLAQPEIFALWRERVREVTPQLWESAYQAWVTADARRERGEFFTPAWLADKLTERLPADAHKGADIACGVGGLLASVHRRYPHTRLLGVDVYPDLALAAAVRMLLAQADAHIIAADSLSDLPDEFSQLDFVVLNPPFGKSASLTATALSGEHAMTRFAMAAYARSYPEVLFLERAMQLLRPGGLLASVVPYGFAVNTSFEDARRWLASIASSVDIVPVEGKPFGQTAGTGVKVALLWARKSGAAGTGRRYATDTSRADANRCGGSSVSPSQGTQQGDDGNVPAPSHMHDSAATHTWQVEQPASPTLVRVPALPMVPLGEFVALVTRKEVRAVCPLSQPHAPCRYVALSDISRVISRVGFAIANVQHLTAEQLPSRASWVLQPGDVLLGTSGSLTATRRAALAIAGDEHSGVIASNGFTVFRPSDDVRRGYLVAFLQSRWFIQQAVAHLRGHVIPYLPRKALSDEIVVPLVPDWPRVGREMMRRIVAVRQAIDAVRRSPLDDVGMDGGQIQKKV